MKKNGGLQLSGFLVFISMCANAQLYSEEPLIFSRINSTGSARIQAMGGAQVALGGDNSSAYSNPAGLGFYNRSEATLSFGQNFYNTTSNYYNADSKASQSNFNVPGFSVIFHSDKDQGKLISGNFGLSFTRTNNFNQNIFYQTDANGNPNSSLLDYFVQDSYGSFPKDFQQNGKSYYYLDRLAYNNFLIGPVNEVTPNADSSIWHTYINQVQLQQEHNSIDGAQNQFNISYGLNFNDKVYLGGAVGLPSFHYHSRRTYTEKFPDPTTPIYQFDLMEDYSIKGSGINATIGTIIKAQDFVQFGLSIATPTYFYDVSDNYTAVMTSVWDNYQYVDATYPSHSTTFQSGDQLQDSMHDLTANYAMTTPWRIKGGATFFIQKHGFITMEVEKVNYSKSSLTSNTDGLDFTSDNKDIKSMYRNVFNFRGGGEYRYNRFRGRLGYSYMPDPYAAPQFDVDNGISSYTGGVGYRTDKFFVDLGFAMTQWKSTYVPYHLQPVSPVAIQTNTMPAITLTFGVNL